MKLENKHYYWIGAAVLATVIGVVIYKKRKKKKADLSLGDNPTNAVNASNGKTVEATESSDFPIQIGSNGDSVKAIQKYMNSTCPSDLKKAGVYPLKIDGDWAKKTDTASLACSVLKRNTIDKESFDRILRDLQSANISV